MLRRHRVVGTPHPNPPPQGGREYGIVAAMPIINRIADFHADMAAWRRRIHAHPETAFEEHDTAAFVAAELERFGIEVHRGLARTGVVGTLAGKRPGRAIALRADMDALHIHEKNGFAHASSVAGKMHACGHDGHTAMLLGAARYLAETRNFAGTLHFIFQPAEENEGGGREMVADGLFQKFPVEAVYGMHNWPGLAVGEFAIRPGPMLADCDLFEIAVEGRGAHAALPHLGIDPVICAAQIATALQTITSRNTHPLDSAVVTRHANPRRRYLERHPRPRGDARHHALVQARGAGRDRERGRAASPAASRRRWAPRVEIMYDRRYPATVNSPAETVLAADAAAAVVGAEHVERNVQPTMGAEDFAFMLQGQARRLHLHRQRHG